MALDLSVCDNRYALGKLHYGGHLHRSDHELEYGQIHKHTAPFAAYRRAPLSWLANAGRVLKIGRVPSQVVIEAIRLSRCHMIVEIKAREIIPRAPQFWLHFLLVCSIVDLVPMRSKMRVTSGCISKGNYGMPGFVADFVPTGCGSVRERHKEALSDYSPEKRGSSDITLIILQRS